MHQSSEEIIRFAKLGHWTQIHTASIEEPSLVEAINLKNLSLLEPICNGNYDLALRRAVYAGETVIVPHLLRHRNNINIGSQSLKNRTALHFAAEKGLDTIIQKLIDAGAYVNICDDEGNTPAHLACLNNHPKAATILAQNGAYAVQNYAKMTPSMMIKEYSIVSFVEFKKLCQLNSINKGMKPSILTTPFHTLGRPGNAIMPLFVSDDTQRQLPELTTPINQAEFEKFNKIASLNEVPHLSVKEYIDFDKKYSDVLPMHLTQMLKRYGNPNNDIMLVPGTLAQLKKLIDLARNWNTIEQQLKIPFDFVAKEKVRNTFCLQSKSPLVHVDIELKFCTFLKDGRMEIDADNLNSVVADLASKVRIELIEHQEKQSQEVLEVSDLYLEEIKEHSITFLLNEKLNQTFIARRKAQAYVDATLDIEKLDGLKVDDITKRLREFHIPYLVRYVNKQKSLVIEDVNVEENTKQLMENLSKEKKSDMSGKLRVG